VELIELQIGSDDVRDDGVFFIIFDMDDGGLVGFLPGDEEDAAGDRLNPDGDGLGPLAPFAPTL
jgi:hypothetical protein